ncbi:MAG: response regulator transcription factor [Eubacterium sp.]
MFNILIVEDDTHMRELIKTILSQAGYNCKTANDGAEALLIMENSHIDLAVVDIMMPKMDGYEFTKTLRDGMCDIPVLMVTAKISYEDKKRGFLSGTDDFLPKPFENDELLWRVKALLRRSKIACEKVIKIGSTELDYASFTVRESGEKIELTPKEFLLLYKLLSYPNQLFTKRQIMDEIWDFDSESDEHTVEVHINRLREKFKSNNDFSIKTIRGFGYMGINNYEKA